MVQMRSLFYFIKEGVINLRRNFSTALGAVITILLALFIIGFFLLLNVMLEGVVTSVESKVNIQIFVADEAKQDEIDSLISSTKTLPDVKSAEFINKEQALQRFKESTANNPEILEQLDGENPLPASIEVELLDPQHVDIVAQEILKNQSFANIADKPQNPSDSLKYGQDTVERLFNVTNIIRYVGIALVLLLMFVTLVFINNTIRLAILARRREISIMRLVGATNGFIRGPFILEGIIEALVGAVFAILSLAALKSFGLAKLASAITWLPVDVSTGDFLWISAVLVVIAVLIGFFGSVFAMRRYLKV